MNSLDIVMRNYEASSKEFVGDSINRKRVLGQPQTDAEREIKIELPALLLAEIERSGRNATDYRVYGSYGQTNFPFARIPWVAALHREITTSTERGYYIVLLFREDMTGCVLSLNHGYTQFKDAFGTSSLATEKLHESAAVALTYIDLSSKFIRGPINLAATADLGIGYEEGAIASAEYALGKDLSVETFLNDFSQLLDAYDVLRQRIGPNIIDTISAPAEDDFQEAATVLSKSSKSKQYVPPSPGPVAPPPNSSRSEISGYKRDPRVSGAAISSAKYRCEVDKAHLSFVARTTKENFVEAHHLVPLQFQKHFDASLDVLENIVVLCPTCHRKLHHGLIDEKSAIIRPLHSTRADGLKSRGLEVNSDKLVTYYRINLEDT